MPVYNIGYNIATNIDIVLSTFYNFFQHTLEHVNEVTEFLIHRSCYSADVSVNFRGKEC